MSLGAYKARQAVKIAGQIWQLTGSIQNFFAIFKNEYRLISALYPVLFNREKGLFMGMFENRKNGAIINVIQRIVPPVTAGNTRRIGRQDIG